MGRLNPWYAKHELSMRDVLSKLGFRPDHITPNGEIWYLSPFRKNETEASFKICPKGTLPNYVMDVWYDHGEGKGGHIIDFVERYYGVAFSSAMQKLSDIVGSSNYSEIFTPVEPPALPLLEPVINLQDAEIFTLGVTEKSNALRNYLFKRGIPIKTAKPYLKEIHYTHQGTQYYALAFPSDSGGYELRNPHFKGAYKTKDISTINPQIAIVQDSKQVAVFEGFFDFLAYLVHNSLSKPDMPVIVLNSVAMTAKAIESIRQMGAETIHLYLDSDPTGRAQTERFKQELPGVNVLDQSYVYTGYNDYSAFLEADTQRAKSASR